MTNSIKSFITYANGSLVDIECHIANSLPSITIIGYASRSVDEAKDRLRAAFVSSDLTLPKKHIILNLSPADTPKDASNLDLAMAVSILLKSGQIVDTRTLETIFLGELGLDGSLKPIRGIVGILIAAKKSGFTRFYIPHGNATQASLVPGIEVRTISNLKQLYYDLLLVDPIKELSSSSYTPSPTNEPVINAIDLQDITGQELAKRALEIAAAGKHNLLLSGSPGVGKSMLAKAMIGILPPLNEVEMLETTHLHSLMPGMQDLVINNPPLRSPHHTASVSSLIGGGQKPLPGEVSLAHNGVLFLDEINEFNRVCIEALRQPLEDRMVTVSRVKETAQYLSNFILIATQNPCPCGHYGTNNDKCTCTAGIIDKYQRKLSGPILDRIDMHITVEPVRHADLLELRSNTDTSQTVRARVVNARAKQSLRFSSIKLNGEMDNKDIKKFLTIDTDAQILLNNAAARLGLSARSYIKTIKLAQTIADLADSEPILVHHMSEALQYRSQTANSSQLLTPVT